MSRLIPECVRRSQADRFPWAELLAVAVAFYIASAIGIPFVDKTVRVEDVGRSIVAGLLDEGVSGVQRFDKMESLSEGLAVER